jgi:hypothetical protein
MVNWRVLSTLNKVEREREKRKKLGMPHVDTCTCHTTVTINTTQHTYKLLIPPARGFASIPIYGSNSTNT